MSRYGGENFDVGCTVGITLGAIVSVVALVWAIITCCGGGGGTARRPTEQTGKFSVEKDGSIAVLEGGVEVAETVSQFQGCCCGGDGGGSGGCAGCGG